MKRSRKNTFNGYELGSSAKWGWFYGIYIKFLMQRGGFWPKTDISGGQYQVHQTMFRNGQINYGKTAQKNSFYGFEVVSSAKRGWFHGFYIKFLMQRSGFWPKMTILGGHYQVDWTIFETGQFWCKNPENGVFPHFSAPGPPGNFF